MTYAVSPTQIEGFDHAHEGGCNRRWGFRYLSGLKPKQHPAAALGTELHGFGEGYLKHGTQPDYLTKAGDLFTYGLPYLPEPGVGGVEGDFRIEIDGVTFVGQIDYRGPLPARCKFGDREQDIGRVVLDHKTSSNPPKYGVWGEDFLKKPQPVLYGTYDILRAEADNDNSDQSHQRWLYYWTKGKAKAQPSDRILTRTELEDVFERVVLNPGKQIVKLRIANPDPNELDPNLKSCDLYPTSRELKALGFKDGCPYHPKNGGPCKISITQRIARKTEEPKMADQKMLDRIKARRSGGTAAVAANETSSQPEDKINAPEAAQAQPAAKEEKTAEVRSIRPATRAAEPSAGSSDDPSDAEIGRVVRFLAKLIGSR